MRTGKQYNPLLIKLCLAAALFVVLTLLKILLPEQTAGLRAGLREVIGRDTDYLGALSQLGESLAGGEEAVEALSQLTMEGEGGASARALAPAPEENSPELSGNLQLPKLSGGGGGAAAGADGPEEGEPAAEEPETPEVVAAFLESQAEFSDYAVPASVTYEMPALPFEYTSPVAGETSSGFGYRLHPLEGEVKFHYGTDFAVWTGTEILAFADGTVGMAGWDAGFGNYLIINHEGGWRTLYAHCSELLVSAGESVTKGQRIALAGGTGQVTGPHLHLELTCDGIYYNPEFYLA